MRDEVDRAGGETGAGRPVSAWVLSRRQLLGGGLVGAAGLAVGSLPAVRAGAATTSATGTAAGHPGPAGALRVDGLSHPLGLGLDDVYFAWQVTDDRRGARQGGYRIRVSGPVGATGGAPVVWDTGRVASAEQAFVAYGGPALAPDSVYRWTVQTWDVAGRPGPPSPASTFETGLENHDWQASWIGRVNNVKTDPDQYTYARTEFTLDHGPIARARAYVSGDQQYELYVNGVRVGKGQAYSYPDSMYYETVDATAPLRAGRANAVGIVSTWDGPTKGHPAGVPGAVAQLVIHHADGHVQRVVTDGAWRVRPGPWLPGHQRDLEGDLVDFTENIDGPEEPVGWLLPGFDDRSWSPAVVLGRAPTAPWTHLVSVRTRIVEEPVAAVSLTTLASGSVVADFGQVYAAVPTVTFRHGVAGRLVPMKAGFLLDEPVAGQPFDGVPGQVSGLHGTQHTDMSYSYVQRGGGVEEFHPFDYLGFRYFQIDNPGEALQPSDVVALTRHTALPEQPPATFTSNEPVIDAIFALGAHSAVFTAQEQYIDTPTREKGSWLFDGFNESCTTMAAVGEQNSTRKSLQEFAASQRRYWPNGAVNKIYPTGLGALDINESTEAYVEWVWQYWMHTGDKALLESVYPVLRRVSDYVQGAVSPKNGLVTSLQATSVYYLFPTVTRLNVQGVNVFRRTGAIARILGRPAGEVGEQQRRQAALTAAINRHLTRPDGTYVDGLEDDGSPATTVSQISNSCAAAYGVVPPAHLPAVAAYVTSLGMQAPPQQAAEVLATMAMAGRFDDLVALLVDATGDGWANILARGATFTWEVWNPSDIVGDSMSHGWGSNVLVQIQRWLLGVRPTAPGFAAFEVAPPPTGLTMAQGTVPTPPGTIAVAWTRSAPGRPGFGLDVTVPPNTTARATVPATRADDLTEGGRPLDRASGVSLVDISGGSAQLQLGAGSYQLHSTAPA
jgi:alpha-L-rhamnosidase